MSTGSQDYAQRRARLVERLDRDRASVADAFGELQSRMKVAEAVVGAARKARDHRVLAGALAVAAIVAPFTARRWLKRAVWMLPIVVEGIRLMRRSRDDRDDESA